MKQVSTPRPGERARVAMIDAYPTRMGGAQRTLLQIAGGAERFAPIVVSFGAGPLDDRAAALGYEHAVIEQPASVARFGDSIRTGSMRGKVAAVLGVVSSNVAFARFIGAHRVDVVYCSNTRSILLAGAAARLRRRPIVWYLQTLGTSLGIADRIAATLASRILVISSRTDRALSPSIVRRHRAKIAVVPLGVVDDDQILDRDHRGSSGRIRVAFVGDVCRLKGVHDLIEAFDLATRDGLHATLEIIGGSSEPDYLATVRGDAAARASHEAVAWLGPREDVAERLSAIDVLVLPSYREGLPRVIAEAMAAGAFVIATDVGGTTDLVTDGESGLLVPPGEPAMIAAALLRAGRDADLRQRCTAAAAQRLRGGFLRAQCMARFNEEFVQIDGAA